MNTVRDFLYITVQDIPTGKHSLFCRFRHVLLLDMPQCSVRWLIRMQC